MKTHNQAKSKLYYLGIFERGEDGYYVHFPDLPGCISAGDSVQEAAANAEVALATHISGMADDGEALPFPTDPGQIQPDPDVDEVARLLIAIDPDASAKMRVNVMLDRALLAAIDARTDNRSRFLSEAARARLRELAS